MREVRELVFALDADAAGQEQWRQRACQAARRGKRVAVLPPEAYGSCKDVNEAWAAAAAGEALAVPEELREAWAERVAMMVTDGRVPLADAERLAWEGLQAQRAVR